MNSVNLIGHLCKDVDLKFIPVTGLGVAKFTLGVPARTKEKTSYFINCVAFGKTAEVISDNFHKGSAIAVSGYMQTGSYTNKEDVKVYTTDVVVQDFTFTEKKAESVEEHKGMTRVKGDIPF
jgi:single-strand DNA-binding protein